MKHDAVSLTANGRPIFSGLTVAGDGGAKRALSGPVGVAVQRTHAQPRELAVHLA